MGQKIRPTGFRTGIMMGWSSSWYANKRDFGDLLLEDQKNSTVHQAWLQDEQTEK